MQRADRWWAGRTMRLLPARPVRSAVAARIGRELRCHPL